MISRLLTMIGDYEVHRGIIGSGYWVMRDGRVLSRFQHVEDAAEFARRCKTRDDAHNNGDDCGWEKCSQCCVHDERDHGICLDCGHEEDPGAAIDRAMDAMEDR